MTTSLTEVTPAPAHPDRPVRLARRPRRGRAFVAFLGRYGVLLVLMGFLLLPALWLGVSSLRTNADIFSGEPLDLFALTLENYVWALSPSGLDMGRLLGNTVIVCAITALLTTAFCALAGYGLARYQSKGARLIIVTLLIAQMVQGPMIMLPWYQIASSIGLLDTRTVLVLIYQTLTIPAAVWLMSSYFRAIPIELEEAAGVDGAGRLRVFVQIVLPLTLPGIAAVGLYSFILAWNDYQYALTLTHSDGVKTIQVGLGQVMSGIGAANWGGIIAGSMLAIVPVVILFALVQRALIQGLASGAVKG